MNEQEKNVVEYLTKHPDFFTTHPDLLTKLSVVHPQKGTLSLVEVQLEQQRQHIKTLTAFLEKFHQLAYQEADIFYALMPLQKKLFQAENFQHGDEKLKQWAQSYELDGAKIVLFRDAWQTNKTIPEQYWIDRKAFELIRLERLGLRQFYLGDLSNKEKHLMFLPEEFPIGSVAICLLGAKTSHKPTALLLFTSRDTARFHNGQDTTFLKHIVDIVELHLTRWL